MAEFTFDFVVEIESFEATVGPGDEVALHVQWYDASIDDLMIAGSMQYSELLLPTERRDYGTEYEVSMSWFNSRQNLSPTIGDTRSVVELRADFMGIRRKSSDCACFVFREAESTDNETRKGIMDLYPDRLPGSKSLAFLDWSAEFQKPKDAVHSWPMGEPYESYYVTVEFELSPGVLDEPPRKRDG